MNVERCSGTVVTIPFGKHKIDGLFYHIRPAEKHPESRPVILRIHGVMGNLLDDSQHHLPHIFASEGYSSLTMNNFLSNLGVMFGFGLFDKTIPQIDRACDFLRESGFKKIIIAGHGIGGCLAVRYGALRDDPEQYSDIKGVIAIATPYSLPETIQRRWDRFGSNPTYDEVYKRAQKLSGPDYENADLSDETVMVNRAHGASLRPHHSDVYTLKTWWELASPEAESTQTHKQIAAIQKPLLLVHAQHDDVIERRRDEDLGKVALEAGNPDVTVTFIDADHTFTGKQTELGQIIVKWLLERFEQD